MATSIFHRAGSPSRNSSLDHTPLVGHQADDSIDLANDGDVLSSDESVTSPTSADPNAAAFQPTIHLQIETSGGSSLTSSLLHSAQPVLIYSVSGNNNNNNTTSTQPILTSLRSSRTSSDCQLVAGPGWPSFVSSTSSSSSSQGGQQQDPASLRTLSSTEYRTGPGRSPRVTTTSPPDTFDVSRRHLLTHACHFRLHNNKEYEWRYGSREERHQETALRGGDKNDPIKSLLILEEVDPDDASQRRRAVAKLLRSKQLRSQGSGLFSAGNGGRLLIAAGDQNNNSEELVVLAVTTGLVMLKREVDRRKGQSTAAMAHGGAS